MATATTKVISFTITNHPTSFAWKDSRSVAEMRDPVTGWRSLPLSVGPTSTAAAAASIVAIRPAYRLPGAALRWIRRTG